MKKGLGLFLLIMALGFVGPIEALGKGHGVFRVVKGDVQVKDGKTGKMWRARIGKKVYPKDTILTAKDSRAKIVMVDKNVLNISPESQVVFEEYEYEPEKNKKNVLLNVIYGKVRSKVEQKYDGKQSKFQVKTKSAVAGVRGTDFLASYNSSNNQSQVVTFEGQVVFGEPGPGGSIRNAVQVMPGQMASKLAGARPEPPSAISNDQLAEMDQESDAEKAPSGNSDERQPASEGGEQGEGKEDDAGNEQNGDNEGATSSEQSNGSPDEQAENDREPTGISDAPPPPPPPPVATLPPPPPPPVPIAREVPVCDFCRDVIQDGTARVIIEVTNGN